MIPGMGHAILTTPLAAVRQLDGAVHYVPTYQPYQHFMPEGSDIDPSGLQSNILPPTFIHPTSMVGVRMPLSIPFTTMQSVPKFPRVPGTRSIKRIALLCHLKQMQPERIGRKYLLMSHAAN